MRHTHYYDTPPTRHGTSSHLGLPSSLKLKAGPSAPRLISPYILNFKLSLTRLGSLVLKLSLARLGS